MALLAKLTATFAPQKQTTASLAECGGKYRIHAA
jgi:hypothetical protein